MTDESDVRTWLATAEVPELRTDLRQTVVDGRATARRRRVRRIATAGALTLAVLVAVPGVVAVANRDRTDPSPDAPAASTGASRNPNACAYHALTLPDHPDVKALKNPTVIAGSADPTGRYVVGFVRDALDSRLLILWDNGRPRLLPPETRNGFATGVNERGQVLGMSGRNEYGALGPWVYRNGALDRLGIPADAVGSEISGINAAGDVVGYLAYSGSPMLRARTVIWPAGALSTPRQVPDPKNARFSARWFGTDGTLLGSLDPGMRPYLSNGDGTGTELTAPGEAAGAALMDANGDWAVGVTSPGGDIYRWQLSTGQVAKVTVPGAVDGVVAVRLRSDGSVLVVGRQASGSDVVVRDGRRMELAAPDGAVASGDFVNVDGTFGGGTVHPARDPSAPPTGGGFGSPAYWTC